MNSLQLLLQTECDVPKAEGVILVFNSHAQCFFVPSSPPPKPFLNCIFHVHFWKWHKFDSENQKSHLFPIFDIFEEVN